MKKFLALAALCTAFTATTAFAQPGPRGPGGPGGPGGGPGGPGGPGGAANVGQVLKDVLGFSDTQLASFKTLAEARNTAGQALQTQIATAQKALVDALAATTPVPATVGSALLAVRSLEKQGQQIDQTFHTGFKALLTSTQAQKYAELEAFRETGREAGALSSLGL